LGVKLVNVNAEIAPGAHVDNNTLTTPKTTTKIDSYINFVDHNNTN